MTTRYNKVGIKFATSKNNILVSGLSPDESKQFLNVRLEVITQKNADRKQLAEELENIPLALVQAVSFIQQNQTTVKCYLQLYQDSDISKIRLLSKEFEDDTRDRESRNPVATTWGVSFNYIREHDTAAADILSLMSMLDAQAIPESLLPFINDRLTLKESLGTLMTFSLISFRNTVSAEGKQEDRLYDLHRLVRLAMRNWLRMEDSFVVWTARSIETLAARYTEGFLDTRATWLKYLPHAVTLLSCDQLKVEEGPSTVPRAVQKQKATVGHAPDGQICPLCTTKLCSLLYTGYYHLAGKFAQQGLLIGERVLEDGHSYIHQMLEIKANVSFILYDLSGAANLLRRAIDVGLVNLDPLSEEIFDYARKLALSRGSQDIVDQDLKICMERFETFVGIFGPECSEKMGSSSPLASCYAGVGRDEEAFDLTMNAWRFFNDIQNLFHDRIWTGMESTVRTLSNLNRHGESETLCLQLFKSLNDYLGGHHRSIMYIMEQFANFYWEQGCRDEAEHLRVKVLELNRAIFSDWSFFTVQSKYKLASTYFAQGNYVRAENLHLEVLEDLEDRGKGFGEENVNTIESISALAEAYNKQGLYVKAEPLYFKVLELRRKVLGDWHRDTIRAMSNLALTLTRQTRWKEAASLLLEAFTLYEDEFGEEDPHTLKYQEQYQ